MIFVPIGQYLSRNESIDDPFELLQIGAGLLQFSDISFIPIARVDSIPSWRISLVVHLFSIALCMALLDA